MSIFCQEIKNFVFNAKRVPQKNIIPTFSLYNNKQYKKIQFIQIYMPPTFQLIKAFVWISQHFS